MEKIFKKIRRYRLWTSPKEIPLTILTLIYFLLSLYVTSLANAYSDRINTNQHLPVDQRIRLPDPLLDALNPIYVERNIPKDLPDTLVHFAPLFYFTRVALGGKDSLLVLRRLGYLLGLGYLIRIPFIIMTLLPNPDRVCVLKISSSIAYDGLLIAVQKIASCGDIVFSGHTITFIAASLIWVENPIGWMNYKIRFVINLITILYSFISIFFLVPSAYHYTVDVVISVCFNLFFWKFYSFVVNADYLNGTLISKFIRAIDGTKYHRKPVLPVQEETSSVEEKCD